MFAETHAAAESETGPAPLSGAELDRLTLYKWRYTLEACGFAAAEVRLLLFVKWRHAHGRIDA